MKIQAITRDNGAGLTKDVQVLREALPGAEVDMTPWDRPRTAGKWNWNFHLELLNPAHLYSGGVNALVPNPEWFDMRWIQHLQRFDVILAKTKDCQRIFEQYHKNVVYTGWTSPDPGCTVDYQRIEAVHIAGKSIMKGTPQVIEAARKVPELTIHVVIDKPMKYAPPNVVQHSSITDEQLCELRTRAIHLQPSTYEGFGHVVNESRAMGAVIVTTADEPMRELVTPAYALLCPVSQTRHKALATEQIPDVNVLAECLRIAAANCTEHGPKWGALARADYEQRRKEFHERINALVK